MKYVVCSYQQRDRKLRRENDHRPLRESFSGVELNVDIPGTWDLTGDRQSSILVVGRQTHGGMVAGS